MQTDLKNNINVEDSTRNKELDYHQTNNVDGKVIAYCHTLLADGKAPMTIKFYASEARRFTNYLQPNQVGLKDLNTADIMAYLAEQRASRILSQNSYSRLFIAIKSFINFLYLNGCIEKNFLAHVKAPRKTDSASEYLTSEDYIKVLDYLKCRKEHYKNKNIRDLLILKLAARCGLRKSEIIKLDWEDIDFSNLNIKILSSKGGESRQVYFSEEIKKDLLQYRKLSGYYKGSAIRGVCGRRISGTSFQSAVRKIYVEAGVYRKGLKIHSLRHGYAQSLLERNISLPVIQKLLGHKSLDTTAKYLHVTKSQLMDAAL